MNVNTFIKLFIKDRDVFIRYYPHVKKLTVLEQEHRNILSAVENYYQEVENHSYMSIEELKTYFKTKFPKVKAPEIYESIFSDVETMDISDSVITVILNKAIKQHCANMMFQDAQKILFEDEDLPLEKIVEHVETYNQLIKKLDEEIESPFIEDDLDTLLDEIYKDGINWRLDCLNSDIGPISGSTLGHVFARPETGKTTFVNSEISCMAGQLTGGDTILYVCNEEAGQQVKLRFIESICGATEEQIKANKEKAKQVFKEKGGDKVKFYYGSGISIADIRREAKNCNARIIVVDQGDKISYNGQNKAGNGAERLKQLYNEFRNIAIDLGVDVITVGQADTQSEGRKWLQLDNLDGGKVGKPGELDYCIGIGKTHDVSEEHIRFLHVCKNKLKGKHGKHRVEIQSDKARYKDI